MPSSATWTFTDPDTYFAGIRNLQIDGVVTKRGDFRVGSTRIDLHRLWMHRFDENLPRIMRITPSGKRVVILFCDPASSGGDAGQRDRNTARPNRSYRLARAILSSILRSVPLGYHVAEV
jgi:hypothetical protein